MGSDRQSRRERSPGQRACISRAACSGETRQTRRWSGTNFRGVTRAQVLALAWCRKSKALTRCTALPHEEAGVCDEPTVIGCSVELRPEARGATWKVGQLLRENRAASSLDGRLAWCGARSASCTRDSLAPCPSRNAKLVKLRTVLRQGCAADLLRAVCWLRLCQGQRCHACRSAPHDPKRESEPRLRSSDHLLRTFGPGRGWPARMPVASM